MWAHTLLRVVLRLAEYAETRGPGRVERWQEQTGLAEDPRAAVSWAGREVEGVVPGSWEKGSGYYLAQD